MLRKVQETDKKATATDDSNLSVAQAIEPSSVRVGTEPDRRMHQTVNRMALEIAAFLTSGTAAVPSTAANVVAIEPLECHTTVEADLPAPAPLRMHEPGFAIPVLDSVAPPDTSDVCV